MHKQTHAHPLKTAQHGLRLLNSRSKSITKTNTYKSRDIRSFFPIGGQVSKANLQLNAKLGSTILGIANPELILGNGELQEGMSSIKGSEDGREVVTIKPQANLQQSSVRDH